MASHTSAEFPAGAQVTQFLGQDDQYADNPPATPEPHSVPPVNGYAAPYYDGAYLPPPPDGGPPYQAASTGMDAYGFSVPDPYAAAHMGAGAEQHSFYAPAGYEHGNGHVEGGYQGQIPGDGMLGYSEPAVATPEERPPGLEEEEYDEGPPGVSQSEYDSRVDKDPPPPPGLTSDGQPKADGSHDEARQASALEQSEAGLSAAQPEVERSADGGGPLHSAAERQLSPTRADGRKRSRSRSPARGQTEVSAEVPPPLPPSETGGWPAQYGADGNGYPSYGYPPAEYGADPNAYAAYSTDPNGYGSYGAYDPSAMMQQMATWNQQAAWGGSSNLFPAGGFGGGGGGYAPDVCRDFLAGRCHRGAFCRYTHPGGDPRGYQEMCRDFMAGRCVRPNCRFMHGGPPVCRDFSAGRCLRGSECKFFHSAAEPAAPSADYSSQQGYAYS